MGADIAPQRRTVLFLPVLHAREELDETIGPQVRTGANCRIGASAVIDGRTELGDDCEVYPFASIGQIPQDLKFHGEDTRLTIGSTSPRSVSGNG